RRPGPLASWLRRRALSLPDRSARRAPCPPREPARRPAPPALRPRRPAASSDVSEGRDPRVARAQGPHVDRRTDARRRGGGRGRAAVLLRWQPRVRATLPHARRGARRREHLSAESPTRGVEYALVISPIDAR